MITTPGFCTEQISIYLATELSQHEAHADQDEFLRLQKMPLDEAVNRVMAGEFRDAKTCLGLLMAARVLADQQVAPLGRRHAAQPAHGGLSGGAGLRRQDHAIFTGPAGRFDRRKG